MKERHWDSLVISLQHGQCVLVLGPEMCAEHPSFATPSPQASSKSITACDALKQHLAQQLKEENQPVTGTNLSAIAQQFEDSRGFGREALHSSAAQFYNGLQFQPSELYQTLAWLPFSLVLTTCHDGFFAKTLESLSPKKVPVVYWYNFRGDKRDNLEFVTHLSPNEPVIYHLFGHPDQPNSLVLSENDLLDFLVAVVSNRPELPNSLRKVLQKPGQMFLFVGFGIEHWYLRVLLKMLVRTLELNRSGVSFALEPALHLDRTEREQMVLFYQRGTRIEILDVEVGDFLQELRRRFEAAGGFLEAAATISQRPRIFISYERRDSGTASQLFNALQKANFEVWLDEESLQGGEEWNETIEDQLKACDYVVLLHSQNLVEKREGYINKEIALALDRSKFFRGIFLIPLLMHGLSAKDGLEKIKNLDQKPLRADFFDEDVAKLITTIRRDFQLRGR